MTAAPLAFSRPPRHRRRGRRRTHDGARARAAAGRRPVEGPARRRGLDALGAGRDGRRARAGRRSARCTPPTRWRQATGSATPAIVDRFARAAPGAIEKLARLGVRFDRTPDGALCARPRSRAQPLAHRPCRRRRRGAGAHARAHRRGARDAVDRDPRRLRGAAAPRRGQCRAAALLARRTLGAGPVRDRQGRDRDRRDRRSLRREHEPARQLWPRPCARRARWARCSPTWSSCSSIRLRSTCPLVPRRSSARRCEAKARSSSTRAASGSWPRFRAPSWRRATWSRARFGACARRVAALSSTRALRSAQDFAERFPCYRRGLLRPPASIRRASRSRCGRRSTITWAAIAVDAEGTEFGRGLVGLRRSGLDGAARRQSAGEQFARRGRRRRRDRRALDRRRKAQTVRVAASATDACRAGCGVRCGRSCPQAAGVARDGATLSAAAAGRSRTWRSRTDPPPIPRRSALMVAVAALRREHSLGAHHRTDFPSAPATRERSRLTLDDAFAQAAAISPIRARTSA